MPFDKDKKEKEFLEEVRAHATAILESGASREDAVKGTNSKYNLPLEVLEKVVPQLETVEVSKKVEGRLITKADGTKVLVKR